VFTGIIAHLGHILSVRTVGSGREFSIDAGPLTKHIKIGDSICTSGVCLTATQVNDHGYTAHAVSETLSRTTLGKLKNGGRVNLELALALGDRLGGHMVSGHIDGVGSIQSIKLLADQSREITVQVPPEVFKYCIPKGSLTLNGISLTLARVQEGKVTLAIIPHTWEVTNLSEARSGDEVNLEADLVGKYIHSMVQPHLGGLTHEKLRNWGYGI